MERKDGIYTVFHSFSVDEYGLVVKTLDLVLKGPGV